MAQVLQRRPKDVFELLDLRRERSIVETANYINNRIINQLVRLIDIAIEEKNNTTDSKEKRKQGFRITSFKKAINAIKGQNTAIVSGKEAQKLKGIGVGIGQRIDEIIQTGELSEIKRVRDANRTEKSVAITNLRTVSGIGEVTAQHLYDTYGVKTVEELLSILDDIRDNLTHHILVGLKHHSDLQQRIPWAEVDSFRIYIESALYILNPNYRVTICGSYRRNKPTCGDIDILVTHNDIITEEDSIREPDHLINIVKTLDREKLLVDHLTTKGRTKYMGVAKLSPHHLARRIDIRFVPMDSFGAAQLYFTGSGTFNKIMRYFANQRGFTINEYGLYRYINGVRGEKITGMTDERQIFDFLNFYYLTPVQRDFG